MKIQTSILIAAAAFLGLPAIASAAPVVGNVIVPSDIEAGKATTIAATVSSGVSIQSCNLYVDNDDKGAMTVASGKATKSHTFPYSQVYTVFVFCRDVNGGLGKSDSAAVWVKVGPKPPEGPIGGFEPDPEPEQISEPEETEDEMQLETGSLIKLQCPEEADATHPCKAVYYYAVDEKRYAFPNAKVFFTWYDNFDSVVEVAPEVMGSILLGGNVRYRPGIRMVKFTTVNKVYALTRNGTLRWIATEEVATDLYGEDWNTKIDDIPDTFYTNYTFGADITSANDYDQAAEMERARNIDENRLEI
ncbi:hypothetical protein GF380_02630 [Candidatus Uhrbacteria bacterium]|nr:hypothetical protein [Candidatus Uhrbacteria bacterium]MBD3284060.1 hypothetical protein [Candidatus Uhrbacteria bacterium]